MVNIDFKHNKHSFFNLKINLVVDTYYDERMISNAIEIRLKNIIEKNFKKQNINLLNYEIFERRTMHLVFLITPQTIALSKVVNSLKTTTSRLIKKEFSLELSKFNIEKSFWKQEYKIFT
ncbi:transposase [Aliarcobacter butzleri]|uniref:transposase n=1 Tax=Aliarcobacter butzleri TaxID=28197 RepID=UPI002B2558E4|nr:transposase [Aliarcobacter butzleri]